MGITVLVVDGRALIRKGVLAILAGEPDIEVVGEAETGAEATKLVRKLRPQIVFVDLLLPDITGPSVIEMLRGASPDAQIIVLTDIFGHEQICKALETGARSYLLKDIAPDQLVLAIRTVKSGQRFIPPQVGACLAEHLTSRRLSSRELEILELISAGRKNKEIAYQLDLSEATVNVHVKHILRKMKAADRTEAVTIAIRCGLLAVGGVLGRTAPSTTDEYPASHGTLYRVGADSA